MTRSIQKETEKKYAEEFSKVMNLDWKVVINEDEQNYPDLTVKFKNSEFGLEVREIYKNESKSGSKDKKDEIFRKKLLQKLAKKFYENSNISLHVAISGIFSESIIKDLLSFLLSDTVQIIKEGQRKTHEIHYSNGQTKLYVHRLPPEFGHYNRWEVVSDYVDWITPVSSCKLNKLVKDKSMKLGKYSTELKDVSLLLITNSIYNSGKLSLNDPENIGHYGFKNIYFYEYPKKGYIL